MGSEAMSEEDERDGEGEEEEEEGEDGDGDGGSMVYMDGSVEDEEGEREGSHGEREGREEGVPGADRMRDGGRAEGVRSEEGGARDGTSSNEDEIHQEEGERAEQSKEEEEEEEEEDGVVEDGEGMLIHGFASWCPLQLDREVRLGGWFVTGVVNASVILDMPREDMYERMIAEAKLMPFDPAAYMDWVTDQEQQR
eukprot:3543564-Rhodomonas_salina.1